VDRLVFIYDLEAAPEIGTMLYPPGGVTYPITTFKLSCSRFGGRSCIHSAVVEKAEKDIA
jgi:hypothetical protein